MAKTDQPKFGLCDEPSSSPAYIDSDIANEKTKWVAIVENTNTIEVTFTAIDNCIEIRRDNGEMHKRCDGMLTYDNNIIFVELKDRNYTNSIWIDDGEKQLKNTISIFKLVNNIATYMINNL